MGYGDAAIGVAIGVVVPAVLGPREDGEGSLASILSMAAFILLSQSMGVVPLLATSVRATMAVVAAMAVGAAMGVVAVSGPW